MQLNALFDALNFLQTSGRKTGQMNALANAAYASPVPYRNYLTQLAPQAEGAFQQWVKANGVPFDPRPTADYDMRGFYQGLMSGDPRAQTGVNQNDSQLHFTDAWKTPYHESFSKESQYAQQGAPTWNSLDQLVTPDGVVLYDERAAARNNSRVPYLPYR